MWQTKVFSSYDMHAHTETPTDRAAHFLTVAETMERSSYANVAEQHKKELLDIFEARKKVS